MLMLFHKESCPFCLKVRTFLSEENVSYISITSESNAPSRKILEKLGGKMQVPFLVDTNRGEMMYESDEIVKYVESTYLGK